MAWHPESMLSEQIYARAERSAAYLPACQIISAIYPARLMTRSHQRKTL
ncbi:Uncharacterised protein [Brucella anthropi]|nr:hypothetical protein DR92_3906 [Brucella anthropi]SUB44833.1 Uncharacterised protein [Brucella anthropi]